MCVLVILLSLPEGESNQNSADVDKEGLKTETLMITGTVYLGE